MRLFIGKEAKLESYPALKNAFNPYFKGRWTPPEDLHLTLIFLGDALEPQEVVNRLSGMELLADRFELAGVGTFGRPANVFFARCAATPELKALESTVRDRLGIECDKPFSPHVTLMRPKVVTQPDRLTRTLIDWQDRPLGECTGPWKLYQSTLRPEGPIYETLHVF